MVTVGQSDHPVFKLLLLYVVGTITLQASEEEVAPEADGYYCTTRVVWKGKISRKGHAVRRPFSRASDFPGGVYYSNL